jgi:ABC-2 type transport system permease protein
VSAGRATLLITKRELREGVRGKTFLISTVVLLLLLAAIVALPKLVGGKTLKVATVGAPRPALAAALRTQLKALDRDLKLSTYGTAAAARTAVAQRDADAAFVAGGRVLVTRPSPDPTLVAAANAAVRQAFLPEQAKRIGITTAQARAALAPPLQLSEVSGRGADPNAEALAYFTSIVLFISVSIFGQAVLTSVVQEKASRIPEVLLSSVRPWQLLTGKVAGIGALGLAQIVLLLVAGLVADAAGWTDLPTFGRTAPLAFVCFVLGFTLYAVAYAGAGALASRIEDLTSVATPISMTMVAVYLLSFAANSNPTGGLATALTLIPVSAPFTLPGRAAQVSIPLWQYGVSFALMLIAIAVLVRVAGRVYELGLLRSGPRVPFREALQAARRATA